MHALSYAAYTNQKCSHAGAVPCHDTINWPTNFELDVLIFCGAGLETPSFTKSLCTRYFFCQLESFLLANFTFDSSKQRAENFTND